MLTNFDFGNTDREYQQVSPSDNIDLGEEGNNNNPANPDDIDWETATPEQISMEFDIPIANIIVDEETGRIIRIIDKEGDIHSDDDYYGTASGQQQTTPDTTTTQNNQQQQQQPGSTETSQGSNNSDSFNLATETASRLGFNYDHIVLEDGSKLPFSEMTPEVQLETVAVMIQEATENAKAINPFQNSLEENIINTLRSGKTPRELALEILENDGEHLATTLSDFDLYVRQQKAYGVELTPEEYKEAYDAIPAGVREKQIAAYREQVKKTTTSDNVLSSYKQANEQQELQEYQQEVQEFQNTFAQLEQEGRIGNFKVQKELIDDIKNFVFAPAPGKKSQFLEALSTPEGVINAAFWYKNIDQYQQNVSKYVEQKEKEILVLKNQLQIARKANGANAPAATKKADTWNQTTDQNDNLPPDAVIV